MAFYSAQLKILFFLCYEKTSIFDVFRYFKDDACSCRNSFLKRVFAFSPEHIDRSLNRHIQPKMKNEEKIKLNEMWNKMRAYRRKIFLLSDLMFHFCLHFVYKQFAKNKMYKSATYETSYTHNEINDSLEEEETIQTHFQ